MLTRLFSNGVKSLVCVVLIGQLLGCGTLMYPERKGQRGGRVDAGVAVMDALWLLFFVIPGVICFVVDFGNGTIYLPGTAQGSLDMKSARRISFDAKHATRADLERIIERETGRTVRLDDSHVRISKLASLDAWPLWTQYERQYAALR